MGAVGSAEEDFEAFVQARGPALWRRAWLLTGDAQRAEDLLQTALARAWPMFTRIQRDDGSFEAYVRRILVNVFLTWRRRSWKSEIPTDVLPDPPTVAGADAVVLARHDLRLALTSLTAKQRAVIVLRYFDDLTEAQVADRLNCSVGSVKAHHARAISRLRQSAALCSSTTQGDPT